MTKEFYIFFVFCLATLLLFSCSSVEEPACRDTSNPEGVRVVNILSSTDDNESDFVYGTIQVWCGDVPMKCICLFHALKYPSDYGKVNIKATYSDKVLTLVEYPSSDKSENFCIVNASCTIENIPDEDFIIKVYHGDIYGNYNADKPNFVGDTKSIASGEKLEYSYR